MERAEEEWVCRGRVGARFQQERRQGYVAVLQGGGFRKADLISPNYIAQCMGGGVEGKGRAEPRVSLSLSLSHLSLSLTSLSLASLSLTLAPAFNRSDVKEMSRSCRFADVNSPTNPSTYPLLLRI